MKTYDALFISPHLDDAILSCGGLIKKITTAGSRVLIATVFSGKPQHSRLFATQSEMEVFCPEETGAWIERRRLEDAKASRHLGADVLHADFSDAIFRLSPKDGPLYRKIPDLFGPILDDVPFLENQLVTWAKSLPHTPEVYLPLALGNHVDHRLTRQVLENAFPQAFFYEDFPYAHRVTQRPHDLRACYFPLTDHEIRAKIEAISYYPSQLQLLFGSRKEMLKMVKEFTSRYRGERCWRVQ